MATTGAAARNARAVSVPPATAVATVQPTNDEITDVLRAMGYLETPTGGGDYPQRAKVEGATIYLGDEAFISNPKTGTPAFRARLLDVPVEYQGVFLNDELAGRIGRPEDSGKYCKSHFDVETEKREFSQSGASCRACPINPFTKKDALPVLSNGETRKCQWRAEISFQVLDAQGQISDETVWSLDMSTTSIIEFKGTSREPQQGSVSDFNFMQKLARFGAQSTPDNPAAGLRNALTALRLGGVVVDVRQLPASTPDKSRSWYVTSFEPVAILELDEPVGELEAGDPPVDTTDTGDDLPF